MSRNDPPPSEVAIGEGEYRHPTEIPQHELPRPRLDGPAMELWEKVRPKLKNTSRIYVAVQWCLAGYRIKDAMEMSGLRDDSRLRTTLRKHDLMSFVGRDAMAARRNLEIHDLTAEEMAERLQDEQRKHEIEDRDLVQMHRVSGEMVAKYHNWGIPKAREVAMLDSTLLRLIEGIESGRVEIDLTLKASDPLERAVEVEGEAQGLGRFTGELEALPQEAEVREVPEPEPLPVELPDGTIPARPVAPPVKTK